MTEYRPRLVDSTLELWLKTFGAVSLEGPRWTGKTMTCEQFAASAVYLSRRPSDQFDPLRWPSSIHLSFSKAQNPA